MMRRFPPALIAAAVLLLSAPVRAAQPVCERECAKDVQCESSVLDCLVTADRSRDAVDRLKALSAEDPGNVPLARLLAKAYLADNNPFWAQRTLLRLIEADPSDCESRSWLAWAHVNQGDLDLAREALSDSGCPDTPADKARWEVLSVFIARAAEDEDGAASATDKLNDSGELYPEDKKVWLYLRSLDHPGWIEPFSMRLEILGGYTTNARAGSPSETAGTGPGSALGRFDLYGRVVLPASRSVRPTMEGGVKGHGLLHEDAQELSYLDFHARPGVIFGGELPRLLLAYKANLLVLGLKDKEMYYESHRGEFELEIGAGMLAFAGGGRRIFREDGRTRIEFDEGIGGGFPLSRRFRILSAVSLRQYGAVSPQYDQFGVTALVAGRLTIGPGWLAGLGLTIAVDEYPHSGGEQGISAYGTEEKRSDLLLKGTAEIWTPKWHNIRAGLRYELSLRDSTADSVEADYDYGEHRIVAGVRWAADLNPWAPGVVSSDDHVELDYGVAGDTGAGLNEERIQDLLRQDEAARAGSACAN